MMSKSTKELNNANNTDDRKRLSSMSSVIKTNDAHDMKNTNMRKVWILRKVRVLCIIGTIRLA